MSDPLVKENSVLIESKTVDIQSLANAQGGNATIIQVGGGGQQISTTIRKEVIITEQLSDPSYNESSLLLEKNVSPEIIHKTTIIEGVSHEFRGGGGMVKGEGDEEENYRKALTLSGGVSHLQNCVNIETCQDPSHLISMGGRMEGVERGRGQAATTFSTYSQNQNSAMMGGQTVYVGGGGGGGVEGGVYRENVVYAAGGENMSLVRGGGGGATAGYQTFQPMSVATASTNFKSHGGAGAGVVIVGGECKLTPALCALLLCNVVFWAIVLMLIIKEI